MKEYYSLGKTQSLCNKIANFAQYPTKTISEAFERFNEYTRAVPHHKFPKEDLVQKFYHGLVDAKRAPGAKHTASRTKLASHAQRAKDVPVNFS
jgi:hypothetical protein